MKVTRGIGVRIGVAVGNSVSRSMYGPELNSGYNFPDLSAYNISLAAGHTATAVNNVLEFYLSDNNFSRIYLETFFEIGKTYRIEYIVDDIGYSGAVRFRLPLTSGQAVPITSTGSNVFEVTAQAEFGGIERNAIGVPVTVKFSLFSIKEIL